MKPRPGEGSALRTVKRGRRERDLDPFGLAAVGEVPEAGFEEGHVFEGLRVVAVVQVGGVGLVDDRKPDSRSRVPKPYQPLRLRIGQGVNEDGAHQAEDRRVGSDAEAERQDGDGGETGVPEKTPEGVTEAGCIHAS